MLTWEGRKEGVRLPDATSARNKEPVAKNYVERDSFLKLVYYLSQLSGRNSSIRMLSMVLNEELRLPTKYSDLKPKF